MNLTRANHEGRLLLEQQPVDQKTLTRRQQENKAMLALIRVKINSLEGFLTHQRRQQQSFSNRLKNLQQSSLEKSEGMAAQEQIRKINALTEVNHNVIDLISDDLALSRHYQTVLLLSLIHI